MLQSLLFPLSLLFLDLFTLLFPPVWFSLFLLFLYLLSSLQVIRFLKPAGSDVFLLHIIYLTFFIFLLSFFILLLISHLSVPILYCPSFLLFILSFLFSLSPCQPSPLLFIYSPFSPFSPILFCPTPLSPSQSRLILSPSSPILSTSCFSPSVLPIPLFQRRSSQSAGCSFVLDLTMWLPGSYSGTWFCQAPWNGPANPTAWPRRKRQQTPIVPRNLCVCLCVFVCEIDIERESLCLYSVIDDAWMCVSIFLLWSNFWCCFVAQWFLTLAVALQSDSANVCVCVYLFTYVDSFCVLWADCDTHEAFWSNAHASDHNQQ